MRYIFTALLFWCITANSASAQQIPEKLVTGTYAQTPLTQVLQAWQAQQNVAFYYNPEWTDTVQVAASFTNEPLPQALEQLLKNSGLEFILYDEGSVVILPSRTKLAQQKAKEEAAKAVARKIKVTGTIKDAKTNEAIAGASILLEGTQNGTLSDANGRFSLTIPAGESNLIITYLGYEKDIRNVYSQKDVDLPIGIFTTSEQLKEVKIFGDRAPDQNIESVQSGITKMDIAGFKKIPAFLGEVDVIKGIKLLPGVSSIGEAATGFNVRGGSVDQNLVLLDDAPIFNSSHLFGFFSVFNPNAVSDVTLYRGGIPAQYGGRISSVLDVKQKEGNYKKFAGNGGIGVVSSRMALEGPIIKDKTSFVVAGRASYSDWLLGYMPNISLRNSTASFYDLSAKLTHKINDKNKLSISGYRSRDEFGLAGDTLYNWTSTTGTIKYSRYFTDNLVMDLSGVYSNYDLHYLNQEENNASDYSNGIEYKNIKADFLYTREKHQVNFGASSIKYSFRPGEIKPNSGESQIQPLALPQEQSVETALYLNDEFAISPKVTLMVGLRYSLFANIGAGDVYTYAPDEPKKERTITDTTTYTSGEIIKTYQGLEPRFSLKYSLDDQSSVKLGYNRNRQYVHLISNTASVSPIDIWKTSNTHIAPQIGDQVSLGYFRNFSNNNFETSIEGYYKHISNILDYKDGANLFLNETLEADLLPGKGKAYGLEVALNKKSGIVSGWMSYTYARTMISVNGNAPSEKINDGNYYPASFDKPHTFNFVGSYQVRKRIVWSANFTYSTGRAITAPTSYYIIDGHFVPNYGERNQYRIPDYHRLDLSLAIYTNYKRDKKWEGNWNISVYNVYSRKNPYSVFFKHSYGSPARMQKLSVVGVPLPSVSYDFRF
ncbi:TonB-dependent receptor [Pontibacter sp. KCTC 32443]|uniref:TonB-dependent receptor n=1 Tax=Pontibacter TaxID=323449 RepID=UPI00164DDEA4|nr:MULTISPECIES: TonB-dependent receptor [Pontibacter]MBC5775845.1 TonB-dependent receptor [Pontibacter sp. KCTC 32443]